MQQQPKLCRTCGEDAPLKFAAMSRRECVACQGARRGKRQPKPTCKERLQVRPDDRACAAHLSWVRSLPCSVKECREPGASHAHHVRLGTGGGTGLKPPDSAAVPLCGKHHGELHQGGQRSFDKRHGLNLRAEAERLASIGPWSRRTNS